MTVGAEMLRKENNNAEQLYPSHKCAQGRRGKLGFCACFVFTGMEEDSVLGSLSQKHAEGSYPLDN